MRCTSNIVIYLAVLTATLHAQTGLNVNTRDLNRRGVGVNRLQIWVDGALAHRGGVPDEATRRIAAWTPEDFEELLIDLPSVLKLMLEPRGDSFSVWIEEGRNAGRRRVVYSGDELERLRRMARAAGGRDSSAPPTPGDEARIIAAQNRLLKRGAAMHTTIGLGRKDDDTTARPVNLRTTRWEGSIQFADGRQVGLDNRANQWRFARRLLDLVTPKPSGDNDVRAWYRAACAALLHDFQLHLDHFERTAQLFPDDALLLMLGGSLREALASARVQVFVKSAVLPGGATLRVGSARAELGRAEPLLRRAVKIDPRDAEARVRLGRVLSLLDRHADALTELRGVASSAPQLLQYYAALFTGDAAAALGRVDEARAAFDRAADLYPFAQAPRFGLSQLATTTGDAERAAAALEEALLEPDPSPEDDPYWTYHTAAGRDANELLAIAYRALTMDASP